ncbi:hypothetical protein A2U01_0081476, partial [Trifolium medium]|nr:hypothetical protein [Trifolium medium]
MIVLEETTRAKKAVATVTDNFAFLASQDNNAVNNSSSHQNYHNHGCRGNNSASTNRGRRGNRGG